MSSPWKFIIHGHQKLQGGTKTAPVTILGVELACPLYIQDYFPQIRILVRKSEAEI